MSREMKAWSALTFNGRHCLSEEKRKLPALVCAATKKRAAELLGCSQQHLAKYWCPITLQRYRQLLERGEGVYVYREKVVTSACTLAGRWVENDWEKIA